MYNNVVGRYNVKSISVTIHEPESGETPASDSENSEQRGSGSDRVDT